MPLPDPSDDDLARATARGDEHALGELYRRHATTAFRAAYRVTGSVDDADDVLQDVFVGLPHAIRRYRAAGRFASWIGTVATRTALMRLRGRAGDRGRVPLDAELPGPPTGDPIDRIAVRDALAALPDALRIVFVLREVSGHTHEEIAALLDISPAASRVRLHRAWRLLEGIARENG